MDSVVYVVLALVSAGVGALGGLGGAVLLVPALVFAGVPASEAAPLGLLSVAAGSIAAAPRQLAERSVNHRLGITTELAASGAAIGGALASGLVSEAVLVHVLALTAMASALAGFRRVGVRNLVDPAATSADVGERVGSLAGAYPAADGVAPYRTAHLRSGMALMALSGLVAGVAGVSGGFIKTPAMSELMHVPTKVAAATTTFTVGITSSAALVVFALHGRLDARPSAAVVLGALAGGQIGARLQSRLSPVAVRQGLALTLLLVALVLVLAA